MMRNGWRLCRARLAATPQVTQELELEWEADGRWLAEFMRFPGVAAYGPSKEEAIRNAAKVLIESEQASPTKCSSPYHRPTSMFCLDCIPPDAPISVLLLSNREPSEDEIKRGLDIANLMEQASPTPEQSRNTGVSLDGGKTIHSKFKND